MSDDIERRLAAVIATCRVPIGARCRSLLDTLVAQGVETLSMAPEPDLDAAEAGLRRLLDDMVQQTRNQRFEALHEPSFFSALHRLCPLPPFC